MMQNRNVLIGFGILLVVVLLGAGYVYFAGGAKPIYGPTQPRPTSTSTVTQPSPTSVTTGEVRELTISGDEYKFTPATINLAKGERVRITFRNTGRLPHNITIKELGVESGIIPGGQETTVDFTVEKSGNFTMYCAVGNHRSLGMEGEVEIK